MDNEELQETFCARIRQRWITEQLKQLQFQTTEWKPARHTLAHTYKSPQISPRTTMHTLSGFARTVHSPSCKPVHYPISLKSASLSIQHQIIWGETLGHATKENISLLEVFHSVLEITLIGHKFSRLQVTEYLVEGNKGCAEVSAYHCNLHLINLRRQKAVVCGHAVRASRFTSDFLASNKQ